MVEESENCSDLIKEILRKLVRAKKDDEDIRNSAKCWIWDKAYVDGDIKVRGHCHGTGKYRDSTHRDINIKVKLNHKIPVTKLLSTA